MFMLEPPSIENTTEAIDQVEQNGVDQGEGPEFLHGSLSDIVEEDRNSFDVCFCVSCETEMGGYV